MHCNCNLVPLPWWWRQQFPPKRWYLPIKLHVTCLKTVIFWFHLSVAGYCEHGHEYLGSIKAGNFLTSRASVSFYRGLCRMELVCLSKPACVWWIHSCTRHSELFLYLSIRGRSAGINPLSDCGVSNQPLLMWKTCSALQVCEHLCLLSRNTPTYLHERRHREITLYVPSIAVYL
jgi:hypothetical protein